VQAVAARPLAPVKTGGLGQREVQRVARACSLGADPTRLWLELAVRVGLLGPGEDGQFRPTAWLKAWHAMEAADQRLHDSGDPAVLTGYLGKSTAFEDAIAEFSVAYADQNERDHTALLKAIRSGRIEARMAE